jgi:hypothetical protein
MNEWIIFLFLEADIIKKYKKLKTSPMKTVFANFKVAISLFVIIAMVASGCQGKKGTPSASEGVAAETEASKDEVLKEISDYPLPTAFEVTKLLNDAGASYILDLSNKTDNVGKYISLKSKALNLGVYGADLSYAATYNQTQETMQYLETSSRLIDELQISTAFNQTLVDRVEANLDNVDSLINIISDSFYDSYRYLQENQQDKLSLLILSGSWIEALYITTQISTITEENQKIVEIISDQKSTLNKLLELLNPAKDEQIIADVYANLTSIKAIYDSADDPFSKDDLEKIISTTEKIRNSII